jgi:hypothetical protein
VKLEKKINHELMAIFKIPEELFYGWNFSWRIPIDKLAQLSLELLGFNLSEQIKSPIKHHFPYYHLMG